MQAFEHLGGEPWTHFAWARRAPHYIVCIAPLRYYRGMSGGKGPFPSFAQNPRRRKREDSVRKMEASVFTVAGFERYNLCNIRSTL